MNYQFNKRIYEEGVEIMDGLSEHQVISQLYFAVKYYNDAGHKSQRKAAKRTYESIQQYGLNRFPTFKQNYIDFKKSMSSW